jgi:hypothetical protein
MRGTAVTAAFFDDVQAAQKAAAALIDGGFDRGDVSIVTSESTAQTEIAASVTTLVETGIPEREAEYYTEGVRRGGALVTVRSSRALAGRARRMLGQHRPVDIYDRAFAWRDAGWTEYRDRPKVKRQIEPSFVMPGERVSEGFLHYQQEFNDHWEQTYSGAGRSWDEYRPAYQFGYDAAYNNRYRGRSWAEIAGALAREWAEHHPGVPWERISDAVYYAWDRICCETLDLREPQEVKSS